MSKINSNLIPIRLGLIGTLKTRYKGIQTVFQALAKIQDSLSFIEFHVLGPGDTSPWVREAEAYGIDSVVRFDGTLPPGEKVMRWLDSIDIYLQPSFKEGLPRALIEAMSRGCPAIASNCAGIPELLSADCLIDPGDSNRLAQLVKTACSDIEWRRTQAINNFNESAKYSSDFLMEKRISFWRELAGQ